MPTDFDAILQTARQRWQKDDPVVAEGRPSPLVEPPAITLIHELRAELEGTLGKRFAGIAPLFEEIDRLVAALYPTDGAPALGGAERLKAQETLAQRMNEAEDILDSFLIYTTA